ncbi:MAG: Na/Pi cotransporter family protein, partial [Candidatus Methylomirabilales bacterium]
MPVLVTFLGGAALLVYGMRLIRDGLQRLAGGKLRGLLGSWTDRPAKGLLAGAVVTALMQSSTATSVMLVGFTSAGLMTLSQALAVILGADVGTTLTVQLLAFRILDYGLVFVAVGVALLLWPTRRSLRDLGTPILGFGLLFFSIKLMGDGMSPVKGSPILEDLLTGLTTQPLLGIAAAAVFAFLVHSSAATIAIALSLALEGILNLQAALPIIIGANLGTCGTALLSSIGTGAEARRVAWSHLLFKGVGAAVLLPLLPQFAWMVEAAGGDLPRQIANAHTLFNVGIALAFLPFTGPVARVVTRLVPTETQEVTPGQPRYLDTRIIDTPSRALGQATREALRVADVVSDMLRGAGQVLVHPDPDMIERVQRMDNQVDNLDREIKRYLARLAQEELTQEQSRRELAVM